MSNIRFDSPQDSPGNLNRHAGAPRLRVLVIDDDADTRDAMTTFLGLGGFEALAVRSGLEALQAAHALCPDMILLDVGLPGVDGVEVAKGLRAQVPASGKVPFVIAVAGYADAQTRQHSAEAGIDLYLVKPVDPAALVQDQGTCCPSRARSVRAQ